MNPRPRSAVRPARTMQKAAAVAELISQARQQKNTHVPPSVHAAAELPEDGRKARKVRDRVMNIPEWGYGLRCKFLDIPRPFNRVPPWALLQLSQPK